MRLSRWAVASALFSVPTMWWADRPSVFPVEGQSFEDQQRAESEWISDRYSAIRDLVLPSGDIQTGEFPLDTEWIVTFRVSPVPGFSEFRASLRKRFDRTIVLSYSEPIGGPIAEQLRSMRARLPTATPSELAGMIALRKAEFNATDIPELIDLVRKLENLKMPAIPSNDLYVDAPTYEFWLQSTYGAEAKFLLIGPGPSANKQPHPLLEWAEHVRALISAHVTRLGI